MIREGAHGKIYVSVVQAVIIYRSKTWVMKLRIGRVLGGFHHRLARSLMMRKLYRRQYGVWVYPLVEETMEEEMMKAGLKEVDTYVSRRHNTVKKFIATRTLMDLCLASAQRQISSVPKR